MEARSKKQTLFFLFAYPFDAQLILIELFAAAGLKAADAAVGQNVTPFAHGAIKLTVNFRLPLPAFAIRRVVPRANSQERTWRTVEQASPGVAWRQALCLFRPLCRRDHFLAVFPDLGSVLDDFAVEPRHHPPLEIALGSLNRAVVGQSALVHGE